MKIPNKWLALAGLVIVYIVGTPQMSAQQPGGGRGNFDPEQFRQRMMDRMREELEVKNDDEWKLIQGRIEKVMAARQASGPGLRPGGFGGFGGFGGRRGGGAGGQDGDRAERPERGQGGDRGGRRGFGGEPNPEVEALQKALDDNAASADIKAQLAKVRADRKKHEAALEQAQAELAKVLSVRQEAKAVMMGLIP